MLLGASNLARGIASAVATAGIAWNEPLDLLAALGHGRSYGQRSWVLGRSLPGIVQCQLWQDLDARASIPTSAIVTDVGNDILYDASPEKISAWVRVCVERLQRHAASIVITGIPLASLALMKPLEFRAFRTILYPFSAITFAQANDRARELDGRLRELASECGVQFLEPPQVWYGFDRIHIRRAAQGTAWQQFFTPLAVETIAQSPAARLGDFLYMRSLTPYQRWLFGVAHGRRQPSGRLRNGTLVSVY